MKFPRVRLRRLRQNKTTRAWAQEHRLHPEELIQPVFIIPGENKSVPIEAMPGVSRLSLDKLFYLCDSLLSAKVSSLALFPVIDASLKTSDAKAALDPNGLVPTVAKALKERFPEMNLIADIALDPYTSHGQDGLLDASGNILNDETVEILCQQAIVAADAGIDVVAPSDMMDGRIGRIRDALEAKGHHGTIILSYAAKYASAFYGPFREAVGSGQQLGKADKKTYQMDPANYLEAIREAALDIEEGADILMVKPGLPYLDIIVRLKDAYEIPIFAYQVSGEYSALKAASAAGMLDWKSCQLEALLALKRAGASAILTYAALEAADWLAEL